MDKLNSRSSQDVYKRQGYGLEYGEIYAAKHKKRSLLRRVVTIGVPYITISLLYWVYGQYMTEQIRFLDIVTSTLEGDPIVKYSWYSAAIIIVYVFFEISKMNSSKSCNLYVMTLLLVGYIMFGVFKNYSVFWYNTVLIVLVGILVARYKEQIYSWIEQYDKASVIVSLIALGAGTVLQIKYGNSVGEVAKAVSYTHLDVYKRQAEMRWKKRGYLTLKLQHISCTSYMR